MCVSILSIFFFRPPIRTHDLSLLEHDCHTTAQEIESSKKRRGDQADDGQVDEIQAVRVPRSVFPLCPYSDPGPIRNDVSDNVGKDLNGYVHLHGHPLPHCIRSEDTHFRPFRCWQAR